MAERIPDAWREAVIRILKNCDRKQIIWTNPARTRWETDTFGNGWENEAYDCMRMALEDPNITGNQTTSYAGQEATYEFLFWYNQRRFYGKIALNEGRLSILVLSAHEAKRSTL